MKRNKHDSFSDGAVLHRGNFSFVGAVRPRFARRARRHGAQFNSPLYLRWTGLFLDRGCGPRRIVAAEAKNRGVGQRAGAVWSFSAGVAGAIGALGIIVAFKARGNPVYVMPLVFGCAPVVNTFVTMWMTKTGRQAGFVFYLGVLTVAVGAAGVLMFKPRPVVVEQPSAGELAEQSPSPQNLTDGTGEVGPIRDAAAPLLARELITIILGIVTTAICWGCYGPVLHKGQLKMGGSRLRPFLCVGLAYFVIAVVLPMIVVSVWSEPGHWSTLGTMWALGAGAFGAVGALGIIMAFNFGGRPIYVMPLVFGWAPVVNTFASIIKSVLRGGGIGEFRALFGLSLLLVILGAVLVLVFSPKPQPKPPSNGNNNEPNEAQDGKGAMDSNAVGTAPAGE